MLLRIGNGNAREVNMQTWFAAMTDAQIEDWFEGFGEITTAYKAAFVQEIGRAVGDIYAKRDIEE